MDKAGETLRDDERRKRLSAIARSLRNRAHQSLLTEIGRALGTPGPFQERSHRWWFRPLALPPGPDNVEVEVLAGTVAPHLDRVAWIERRVYGNGGWEVVTINLTGSGTPMLPQIRQGAPTTTEGVARVCVPLEDDRADRVTGIHHLELRDRELVVVYGMGGNQRNACRLTFSAPGLDGVAVDRVRLKGPFVPVGTVTWEGPGKRYAPDESFGQCTGL